MTDAEILLRRIVETYDVRHAAASEGTGTRFYIEAVAQFSEAMSAARNWCAAAEPVAEEPNPT